MMIQADVRNKNDESSSEHMDFTRKNTCKRKIGIFAMKNMGAQFDVIIKNCQKMGGNHQKVGFDQVGWYYKMIVSSQVDHLFLAIFKFQCLTKLVSIGSKVTLSFPAGQPSSCQVARPLSFRSRECSFRFIDVKKPIQMRCLQIHRC